MVTVKMTDSVENCVSRAGEWLASMNISETEKVKLRRIRSHISAAKTLRELEKADSKLRHNFSSAYDLNNSIDALTKALTAFCRTEESAYKAGAKAWELVC